MQVLQAQVRLSVERKCEAGQILQPITVKWTQSREQRDETGENYHGKV